MTIAHDPIRWPTFRPHPEQYRLWRSPARFCVVPAGRRSGKTAIAKRRGIMRALCESKLRDGWFVFAAPTHDQAVRIFWDDLRGMIPEMFVERIREQSKTIRLVNGSEISVLGLDRPERIEGRPLDWICIDEFANTRKGCWSDHVRPALSTPGRPPGGAWLIGVPEGRNHYWTLYNFALNEKAKLGDRSDWDVYHWKSADILDAPEIEAARSELDPLSFSQEYEASFVNFAGRAYYPFERQKHAAIPLAYDPHRPLIFAFDFNVEPGVAAVGQEVTFDRPPQPGIDREVTAWLGEVWIPRNSNTPAVCRKLVADWGPGGRRAEHTRDVLIYGDATGGVRGTAKVDGSDWDLVKAHLKPVFGDRLKDRVLSSNPPERARVNATNSRLLAADGTIRMLVDPVHCPQLIADLEGVTLLEGGSGEIDKDPKRHPERTHLTDAVSYYVHAKHPTTKHVLRMTQF